NADVSEVVHVEGEKIRDRRVTIKRAYGIFSVPRFLNASASSFGSRERKLLTCRAENYMKIPRKKITRKQKSPRQPLFT
ncbi:hypothetical protein ACVGW7_00355, partial [Enterobacter intestinihominis]